MRQERERGQAVLAAVVLLSLVVAFLLATWLIAVGLWWVMALVGVAALVFISVKGWWKP